MGARSAKEIWEAALGELQVQVSRSYYRTWLNKTAGLTYQDDQFVVSVPNTFVAEYLDQNQRSLIEKTLIGLTQRDIQVSFYISGHQDMAGGCFGQGHAWHGKNASIQQLSLPIFNSRYTFESFTVGACNRLAYDAALEVARNPGHTYNPLLIYGGDGLGKTHLLHAIGNMALNSQRQVLYISAEQFTNEFVGAIRQGTNEEFRNKFRKSGMLLLDDIHFISGKKQTEESFFHTFNELHDTNHQIVVTSDRSPKSMELLEDRLRSRLEGGLVADVQPPDFETRLAILKAKASAKSLEVAPDVFVFIAERIQQNIRELEGALNRVTAYARLTREAITPQLAARAIENITGTTKSVASITPAHIVEAVAASFQLEPQDLTGRNRSREVVLARHIAMYLSHQETDYSLTQIGREFGNRDHHVVSHAHKKIATDMDTDAVLRDTVRDIQYRLHPASPR